MQLVSDEISTWGHLKLFQDFCRKKKYYNGINSLSNIHDEGDREISENKRQMRNTRFRSHVFTCKRQADFLCVDPHPPLFLTPNHSYEDLSRVVLVPFQNCPVFPGHAPTVLLICSLFRISAYSPVPGLPLFPSLYQEIGLASRNTVLIVVLIHVVSVPTSFDNKLTLIQLAPTG